MTIAVTNAGRTLSRQTRAYAEYRLFSTLARFSDVVRDATVSLTPPATEGESVVCGVAVTVAGGRAVRVTVRGRHAYDAIDRAAQGIGDVLRRHTDVAPSS